MVSTSEKEKRQKNVLTNELVVCAINGQCVLQITEPIDETNWNNLAPFYSPEAQAAYDAFVTLE